MVHRDCSDFSKVIEKGTAKDEKLDRTFDIFLRDLSGMMLPSLQTPYSLPSPSEHSSYNGFPNLYPYSWVPPLGLSARMGIHASLSPFQHTVEKRGHDTRGPSHRNVPESE